MPYAQSAGAEIHYTVSDPGARAGDHTVLLIMGLGGNATEWGEVFPDALAQRFRVVRMDNRGIGQSKSQVAKWTMSDMARDALAVLDAVGVTQAYVVGTSMGGRIAQTIAIEHPERVSRLVLICTNAGGSKIVPPTQAAAALFAPAPGMTAADLMRRTLRTIMAPTFAERNPEAIEHMVALRGKTPTPGRVFIAQVEALLASDRSKLVSTIACPTLVVHGIDDSLVPVDNGRFLASRIPNAELCLLEDCGHMPYLEYPERCATLVIDFLAR
jgi:3-oxoadipate enol-lactonase